MLDLDQVLQAQAMAGWDELDLNRAHEKMMESLGMASFDFEEYISFFLSHFSPVNTSHGWTF